MTLCVAWIREVKEPAELIFATDSVLTGGEKWDSGIKLFELPRKDCLICFAGSTFKAYPLILNLITSIKFDDKLQSQHTDIVVVLEYLSELFTDLIKRVKKEIESQNIHDLRAEAKFLFGGWSWKQSRFRIWELYYSKDTEGFIFKEHTDFNKSRSVIFLGDPDDVNDLTARQYKNLMNEGDFDRKLDMEPLQVLRDISRDSSIREVDGALQIAKIYQSGTSEFFGVFWPSIQGEPCFFGKTYKNFNKPQVLYLDPDTFSIVEINIPEQIDINYFQNSKDISFIRECYPNGELKDVTEKERQNLINIFKDFAYEEFLKNPTGIVNEEHAQELSR